MNKTEVIAALVEQTGYDEATCEKINEILERHFIIGKNNKEKTIADFASELELDQDEAEKLYETAMGIVGGGVVDKLKHPFGGRD